MKLFALLLALCVTFQSLLSADGNAVPPPDQGFVQTLVMIGIALFFFYFILWRPEQKRRKALESQRSTMKKGDRIVCMGVVGTVAKIKDDTVVVHTGTSEIEFLKGAISEVQSATEEVTK